MARQCHVHGYGTTGDMWGHLRAHSSRPHIIVPDLRGLGLSSKPDGGYDKKIRRRTWWASWTLWVCVSSIGDARHRHHGRLRSCRHTERVSRCGDRCAAAGIGRWIRSHRRLRSITLVSWSDMERLAQASIAYIHAHAKTHGTRSVYKRNASTMRALCATRRNAGFAQFLTFSRSPTTMRSLRRALPGSCRPTRYASTSLRESLRCQRALCRHRQFAMKSMTRTPRCARSGTRSRAGPQACRL